MTTNIKIIKISFFSIFFIFIIIYVIFSSKSLIFGIKIKSQLSTPENINIKDGEKITNNPLKITGNAKNAKNLTLNGREINIDPKGNFNESVSLLEGYNVINLTAKDKFGNTNIKNYKLMKN
ncbi:MAG: hypothetical protein AAB693_02750 [Patescibacteria group bacterium]